VNWRDSWTVFRYEASSALRERNIVVNSILVPIFLYPFLLWAMFTGILFVSGQTEGFISRVVFQDFPGLHPELERTLRQDKQLKILDQPVDEPKAVEQLRAGDLDLLAEFRPPDAEGSRLAGNFQVRLVYDQSKDRSKQAKERLEEALRKYRGVWLDKEAARLGVLGPEWRQVQLELRNVASERDIGAFILSRMLPLFLVIMISVGSFYPAVDATAGERERRTWETLMSTAASRTSILAGKYLYVAAFGTLSGLVNLAAMVLSMRAVMAPLLRETGDDLVFRLPLHSIPVMAVGTVLLALFVAGVMMILASFARTFREGQSLITPFYLATLLPVIFVEPEKEFTITEALIPILNLTKLFSKAIVGQLTLWPSVITLAVAVFCIVLSLRLASFIVRFEDFLVGSYSGSAFRFVKERLFKAGRRAGATFGGAK
jgi:sodium transport system permease protein